MSKSSASSCSSLADGRLLVNEMAPRVHNSGHWTLDGCEVDQFEQHIRAIAGWPLGPVEPLAHVEDGKPSWAATWTDSWPALIGRGAGAGLVLRAQGRGAGAGRKMGHVNRLRPLKD